MWCLLISDDKIRFHLLSCQNPVNVNILKRTDSLLYRDMDTSDYLGQIKHVTCNCHVTVKFSQLTWAWHGPGDHLFWKPNYANSATFWTISATQPPLLTNLDTQPPLFTNSAFAPAWSGTYATWHVSAPSQRIHPSSPHPLLTYIF